MNSLKKGFVIAATGSGSGKTTVSLALLAYLKSKGVRVAPFKVGPDFIDPGHHTRIAGKTSVNLDSWMLSKNYNRHLFSRGTQDSDIAVVEGVMGLFDGFDGLSEAGSTSQMAKWLGLPVVLVVSARGMARSAAAIVKGFENFDPELNLAGVIFSRIGSPVHYEYLKTAVEQSCRTKVLGYMPRNEKIIMPERHLGLMTADELTLSDEVLSLLISMVEDHIDMDGLMASLPDVSADHEVEKSVVESDRSIHPRIGVARDKAFCFYYQDNIDILKAAGAEIVEFSPITDPCLPDNLAGIYFGGGYPEVFAHPLAANEELRKEILANSRRGMPIYGECGGFIYLSRNIAHENQTLPMTGCFDFSVLMSKRLRSLGYREILLKEDTIIGKKGEFLRGHEFHYSSLGQDQQENSPVKDVYHVTSRAGQEISLKGFQINNTLGSYMHVHFGSNPSCARHFVRACAEFNR